MIMQGICAPQPHFIGLPLTIRLSIIRFSSDGVGNVIRPLGTQADYVCLSGNPFFVLRGTRASADVRLLVVDAFALLTSGRISKYRCPRHVPC
jgi:hypothetical protein